MIIVDIEISTGNELEDTLFWMHHWCEIDLSEESWQLDCQKIGMMEEPYANEEMFSTTCTTAVGSV